jgi:pimeloyl-ACP methyl ester carboxylesterase
MEQIKIAGLRIACSLIGDGPALVVLHGVFSDHQEWRRQIAALSDEFMVVVWDAPGCGQSADPPERFRLPEYADCLAALIDALGVERAHVVGLSFGDGRALELYRRRPTVPLTLVLASAYAGWAGSLPSVLVEQRLRQAIREADLPLEQWRSNWIPGLFTEAASKEVIDEALAIMSAAHPAGARAMAHAFAEADLRDVLPRIQTPTLLLYGDADQRVPLDVAAEVHARIPGSKLVIMAGIGHQSSMEAPERFHAEVRNFLRPVG